MESGPIKWKEFKEDFLRMYFPLERREVKVEEFINIKKGNMSVEEYSLKFSMLSRYAPSIVTNLRDKISSFMTGVAGQVREECRTTMLHDDMTLARLMVYAQSIEEFRLMRMSRNLKRSGSSDQDQTMLKNIGLKVKKNLGVQRLNWRKEVVLKMENLHVLLVEKGTTGSV